MNIKSAKYIKNIITNVNDNIKAIINEQEMSVPLDPDNRHYQAILEWVAEGNTIEEAD
jgi:hypothetical protein